MMEFLIIYFFLGAVVGLLAGLFGVGGGLVIVPSLVFIFGKLDVNPVVAMHLAIGTSLATIIITSLSSIHAHHRRGAVMWSAVKQLTPGIVIGVVLGAMLADALSSKMLQRIFAVFEWMVGLQIFFMLRPRAVRNLPDWGGMSIAGSIIGGISSIVGIGGGTLTVPFLLWCNVVMQRAVATSSACGLPIAIAGALSYGMTGWNQAAQLPVYSTGYVYWPALLGITLTSVITAPLGAALAHRLAAQHLQRYFGIFLIALGMYMFFR